MAAFRHTPVSKFYVRANIKTLHFLKIEEIGLKKTSIKCMETTKLTSFTLLSFSFRTITFTFAPNNL